MGAAVLPSQVALADEASDLQARVEETSETYNAALDHVSEVQEQIEENQARIAELEAEMPQLKEVAATSIATSYKLSQSGGGLIGLLLSSEDFNDLVSLLSYLDIIADKSNDAMDELVQAENELQNAQVALANEQAEAEQAAADAQAAMENAVSARQEAQERAAAELAAQQKEAEEALAAAQAAEEEGQSTFTTESGNTATVETPEDDASGSDSDSASTSTSDTDAVTWTERDEFVQEWSGRIDAYLAGSPLAGHGTTFAEAAYDYGVDPRFSPAISNVESSKGLYCFKPHNAWGWGSSSWPDWDTAIRAHVAGLASGYGYTVSVSAAKKYCPPNWQFWYSAVLSNMNSI